MNKEEVLDKVNVIYERVSNGDGVNENNLFSDGNYTEALEILIDYYEVGVIEELENIKAEIDSLYGVYNSHFKERLVIKTDVMQILDKHIKENKQ